MPTVCADAMSKPVSRKITTPTRPISTPATLYAVSLSSPKAAVTITVNSGVVALAIEASPLVMNVCPAATSANGITLFSSPMTKNGIQAASPRGSADR